jgi:type II secretory pathway pseudopilin PulG
MIELIVMIAIVGLLAALISPHISWMEPPQRTLQRAFVEAIDIARSGVSIRFRVDKEENKGAIIAEVLIKEKEKETDVKAESTWKTYTMQWAPTGKAWTFKPEIIYFYQDGMCTPAKIMWGTSPSNEVYLLTVTGYLTLTDMLF